MGRPRKGPFFDGQRWRASLPVAVGTKQQLTFADPDEAAVRRWYRDGENALSQRRPLPERAAYRSTAQPASELPVAALAGRTPASWWAGPSQAHGHRLDQVAEAFLRHRYGRLRKGQLGRQDAVDDDLHKDLLPFFARRGVLVVELVTNELVGELAEYLSGRQAATVAPVTVRWPELDGVKEVTLGRAQALEGLSRSTIKRWHHKGLLPSWRRDQTDGQVRVALEELRAAATPAQQGSRRPLQTTTASNKLGSLKLLLQFAAARGIELTGDPMHGISAVPPEQVRLRDSQLPHIPLREFAVVAAHLSVVHQLTMWLERLLAVRIGEGFGPHVGDVMDRGGDAGGYLVLDRQGGKAFTTLVDGVRVRTDEKEGLKNDQSHRVVALPRQVMVMVRVVIAAFHTDPVTGEVDLDARLIPGLQQANKSGQQGHRDALHRAAGRSSYNKDLYGALTPKRLRACLATDLDRLGVPGTLARRYLGHLAGDDVHAKHYLLDPASEAEAMADWRPVTEAIEELIDRELGGTVLVPTSVRPCFGKGNPLYQRQPHIEATLAACGWFLEPRTDNEEALLGCAQVADILGITESTTRRQLREATIPGGELVRREGREVWMCRPAGLDEHRQWLADHPTIDQLSDELGLTYHQLYALIGELDLPTVQRRKGGEVRLLPEAVTRARQEQDARRQAGERAMPLSVAAVELGAPVLLLENLVRRGVLSLDPEASTPRERWVTRASVLAYAATRAASPQPVRPGEPAVPDAQARAITGLTRPGLAALVRAGVLIADSRQRRQHITLASMRRWATGAGRDDVLQRLAAWQAGGPPQGQG